MYMTARTICEHTEVDLTVPHNLKALSRLLSGWMYMIARTICEQAKDNLIGLTLGCTT